MKESPELAWGLLKIYEFIFNFRIEQGPSINMETWKDMVLDGTVHSCNYYKNRELAKWSGHVTPKTSKKIHWEFRVNWNQN